MLSSDLSVFVAAGAVWLDMPVALGLVVRLLHSAARVIASARAGLRVAGQTG